MSSRVIVGQRCIVRVLQNLLVEVGLAKVPYKFLVESVIDNWVVGIGRVVVQRLTLNIVKLK